MSARVRSSKHGWGSSASPTAPAKILRILPLLELCLVLEQVLPGYLGNRPVSRTHGRVASCRYVVEKTRGRPERPSCPTRGRLRGGQCGSRLRTVPRTAAVLPALREKPFEFYRPKSQVSWLMILTWPVVSERGAWHWVLDVINQLWGTSRMAAASLGHGWCVVCRICALDVGCALDLAVEGSGEKSGF